MAKAEPGKGQHGGNRVGEGLGPDLLGLINLSFLKCNENMSKCKSFKVMHSFIQKILFPLRSVSLLSFV